jgi:very-long-chain enoyl-CoA reductase
MPAVYVIRNSAHYWIFAGLNISYWIFRPDAIAARPLSTDLEKYLVYAGLALYVFGELANMNAHIVLANLRPAGTTVRGIPKGFGFSWCTTPNYFFEIIAWIGVLLVTRSWATALFIAIAWWILQKWAVVREKRYRKEFPDKYKPKLWPLTPFVTLPVRKTK